MKASERIRIREQAASQRLHLRVTLKSIEAMSRPPFFVDPLCAQNFYILKTAAKTCLNLAVLLIVVALIAFTQ